MPEHHPAIAAHHVATFEQPVGYAVDFLGIRTRTTYLNEPQDESSTRSLSVTPPLPAFDEEYFEWIDLFDAVTEAGSDFIMVELGAGFGRWLVRGAAVARQRGVGFGGLAVEAEPTHFRWLRQHCLDNDVTEAQVELTWAAVHAEAGFVPFRTGESTTSYGQGVKRYASSPYPDAATRRRLKARSVLGYPPPSDAETVSDMWVPCVTLVEALAAYPRVDLVDLDVQGLELSILTQAIGALDDRVRRLHVGTHSGELEAGLRSLLGAHGWSAVHDYACQSRSRTPYGPISFHDGVQTWLNPRLDPRHSRVPPERAGGGDIAVPLSLTTHVNALTQEVRSLRNRNRKLQDKNLALRAKVTELRDKYRHLKDRGDHGAT